MTPEQIKELREKFFKECTDPVKYNGKHKQSVVQIPRINMAPHDLFEWFKPYLQESTSNKALELPDDEKNILGVPMW